MSRRVINKLGCADSYLWLNPDQGQQLGSSHIYAMTLLQKQIFYKDTGWVKGRTTPVIVFPKFQQVHEGTTRRQSLYYYITQPQ